MRWQIVLNRTSTNQLNEDITRRKLKKIAAAASRNSSLGFEARVGKLEAPVKFYDENEKREAYRYTAKITVKKEPVRNPASVEEKFKHVLRVMTRCANSEGWEVVADPGNSRSEQGSSISLSPPHAQEEVETRPAFVPPELNEEALASYFGGVYERDAHIRTIHDAVRTCIESGGELLSHVLLYGKPGSCKTVLCKRLKAWYEHDLEEGEPQRVLLTNNISTTKAGLENLLLELASDACSPYVLVMDELEKQPMDNLLCLNTLMSEGRITKLNARIGNRQEEARFTVIGICNDEEKLKNFQNGHLWSRFTHKLPCVRPSRELCEHILELEVQKLPGGKIEWARVALVFGWDTLGQRDLREIKGHLDGRDRLLDSSWQADQLSIIRAAQLEKGDTTLNPGP